jgi:hypothetical protein
MAHSNTVADSDGIKFKSRPARFPHRLLDNPADFVQVNVARHYLTKAVGNADKRLVNIIVSETARMKQRPVRCPLESFFHSIA